MHISKDDISFWGYILTILVNCLIVYSCGSESHNHLKSTYFLEKSLIDDEVNAQVIRLAKVSKDDYGNDLFEFQICITPYLKSYQDNNQIFDLGLIENSCTSLFKNHQQNFVFTKEQITDPPANTYFEWVSLIENFLTPQQLAIAHKNRKVIRQIGYNTLAVSFAALALIAPLVTFTRNLNYFNYFTFGIFNFFSLGFVISIKNNLNSFVDKNQQQLTEYSELKNFENLNYLIFYSKNLFDDYKGKKNVIVEKHLTVENLAKDLSHYITNYFKLNDYQKISDYCVFLHAEVNNYQLVCRPIN